MCDALLIHLHCWIQILGSDDSSHTSTNCMLYQRFSRFKFGLFAIELDSSRKFNEFSLRLAQYYMAANIPRSHPYLSRII